MDKLEREERYIVLKLSDVVEFLPDEDQRRLDELVEQVNNCRVGSGGQIDKAYCVIENNWPIYEEVWGLVEAMVHNSTPGRENLCGPAQIVLNSDTGETLKRDDDGKWPAMSDRLKPVIPPVVGGYDDIVRDDAWDDGDKSILATSDAPYVFKYRSERMVSVEELATADPTQAPERAEADTSLTFNRLRRANTDRLPLFKNSHGAPAHSEPDGSDWPLEVWLQAIVGEVGEYANFRKKFIRGDIDAHEFFYVRAPRELADIQIYLDLFAYRLNVSIDGVFAEQFGRAAMSKDCDELTFDSLRRAGELWCLRREFKPSPETYLQRLVRALGEFPEFERFDKNVDFAPVCADFLVTAQINLDALAASLDIDLGYAVVCKFNEVSERVGADVKL